jgi:Epoxide hydrolase N terminus
MRGRRFNIDISDDTLADLKARLRATRWPTVLNDMNWDDGASLDTIRSLANYWLNTFDWRS